MRCDKDRKRVGEGEEKSSIRERKKKGKYKVRQRKEASRLTGKKVSVALANLSIERILERSSSALAFSI